MATEPTVFLVDDNVDVRNSLQWLFRHSGLLVEAFSSAEQFLTGCDRDRAGCVVLDLHMPGMSGLELQQKFIEEDWCTPVIVLTGRADVSTAVRAMEAGAHSFVEKPFDPQVLMTRIHEALEMDADLRGQRSRTATAQKSLALLTPRERQVMRMVVGGASTKDVARQLGVSTRTIEVHRKHIMQKIGVDSLAQLVMVAVRCGWCDQAAR